MVVSYLKGIFGKSSTTTYVVGKVTGIGPDGSMKIVAQGKTITAPALTDESIKIGDWVTIIKTTDGKYKVLGARKG